MPIQTLPELSQTSAFTYALLLAGGVSLGLPMGAAVVAAGALFGGVRGAAIVILAQAIGLAINWHVCRTWCRGWLMRRLQRRKRAQWLFGLTQQSISIPVLVLLRLAPLPMTVVSACCALSSTGWRPYALASTTLVLRFALMVQFGALGADAVEGHLSVLSTVMTAVAAAATLTLTWLSSQRLKRLIRTNHNLADPLQKGVPERRRESKNGTTQ